MKSLDKTSQKLLHTVNNEILLILNTYNVNKVISHYGDST